jgi:nucleoside-diphosphate-sugar epimerase
MRQRIAVTGASGFVGRHLLRRAAAEGWESIGIARSDAAARLVAEAGGRPALAPALTGDALAGLVDGAVAVVHLAQIGAERGGDTYDAVNVGGTQAVIEACRRAGVPRVVYFSGLGVASYGKVRRCTNRYFLSKLTAEVELFRSGLGCGVFRPSYIVGPGSSFVSSLAREIAAGEVELPGDATYRMQPIAVADATAAILAAVALPGPKTVVLDLVGPEPVTCRAFVERVEAALRQGGRGGPYRLHAIPIEEADRQAAAGGYRGMLPDELDCLLCDEIADARPLEGLLGRPLTPLDDALGTATGGKPRV